MEVVLRRCQEALFLRTGLRVGPMGAALRDNLVEEWGHSLTSCSDHPVFIVDGASMDNTDDDTYCKLRDLNGCQLPLGLAMLQPCSKVTDMWADPSPHLQLLFFTSPQTSSRWFHFWQRHRKAWWRRYASDPSRFSLSETHANSVCIEADFQWGRKKLEWIRLHEAEEFFSGASTELRVKEGRKDIIPQVLECTLPLQPALLAFLCDSAWETPQDSRRFFRLHQRLAPYQVGVSIVPSGSSNLRQLQDLSLHLKEQLQSARVRTFLPSDAGHSSLEAQISRTDSLGIPWCVVANEGSLRGGVMGLRSRDTTLKEHVHLADLRPRILSLLRLTNSAETNVVEPAADQDKSEAVAIDKPTKSRGKRVKQKE